MRTVILSSLIALSSALMPSAAMANHHEEAKESAIAAAVAAPTRSEKNVARDVYRHPTETLEFLGVKADQTVLEFSPGGGWYSEILGPLLADDGTFYAAAFAGRYYEYFEKKMADNPGAFGNVELISWPVADDSVTPGSVDTILTFRNIHNLVMGDTAASSFALFFKLLKSGGTLGVIDHRLPEDRDSALEKSSGYLKVSTVKKLAEDAGFVLEAQSEINANPKDTADWEKGVWTLPPALRNGETDREKYLAIGESDRMTLRFRKPAE